MRRDPIITWHRISRSDAIEAILQKRIAAIGKFCPDAIGLRITLDAPQRPRNAGRGFDVRLHLDLPGPDLDVARSVRQGHAAADLTLAVNAAFNALEERIKQTRKVVGALEVKHHPMILHGEIVEIEPELGYGFLRADNGHEVYFQKDALVAGEWDKLKTGARLRFREEDGEKGPFAADLAPV